MKGNKESILESVACTIKHPDVQAITSAFDLQERGKAAIFELPFNFPVYFTPEALGNVKGFKCPSLPRVFAIAFDL